MRYFLLLIFYLISKFIVAQSYYFPAGQAIWVESYWIDNPDLLGFERTEGSNAYILDRDTILDGKLYRNLSFWKVSYYYRKFSYLVDTAYQSVKIADAGAVRATEDGKIYYRHYGNFDLSSIIFASYSERDTLLHNTDILFYDFNLTLDDTVYNPFNNDFNGVIDSVSFIEIAGRNRKILWIDCNSYVNEAWVEGIGSLKGFFSPCALTVFEYAGGILSCYEEKNNGTITISGTIRNRPIITYLSNKSCQNFLTNISTIQYTPVDLKLYPVPTTDWLQVEYPTISNIKSIQIINFLGQQMAASYQYFDQEMMQINTSNLVPGTYILVLKTDNQIITAKFLK